MSVIAEKDYLVNRKFKNPYSSNGLVEYWDAEFNRYDVYCSAHDKKYMKMDSLVGGFPLEIAAGSAYLNSDCFQCDCRLHSNTTALTNDGRTLKPGISVAMCVKFDSYTSTADLLRFGNGTDTRIYSQDETNIKWLYLNEAYNVSSMSVKSGDLTTAVFMYDGSAVTLWINGKQFSVDGHYIVYSIGGGVNFMGHESVKNVNGKFYNAMIYDHVLTDLQCAQIHLTNLHRYSD